MGRVHHSHNRSSTASNTPSEKSAAVQPAPKPGEQEAQFCAIIRKYRTEYYNNLDRANEAISNRNKIREEQIESKTTPIYDMMNKDIFQLVEQNRFLLHDWTVEIRSVNKPDPEGVLVEAYLICAGAEMITLRLFVKATPADLELLSRKDLGDKLTVSGNFVANRKSKEGTQPASPADFNASGGWMWEGSSMSFPEYTVVVSKIGPESSPARDINFLAGTWCEEGARGPGKATYRVISASRVAFVADFGISGERHSSGEASVEFLPGGIIEIKGNTEWAYQIIDENSMRPIKVVAGTQIYACRSGICRSNSGVFKAGVQKRCN
jgi:hypothetical protein